MTWHKDFDANSRIAEYNHFTISEMTGQNSAVLFDPSQIHAVDNLDDHDRCLLSVWWRDTSYLDIRRMLLDGSLINWEG